MEKIEKNLQEVINTISKRRKITFPILLIATVIVFLVDYIFDIQMMENMEIQTQRTIVFGLIVYKLIELFIIYKLFYHKHLLKHQSSQEDTKLLAKFEKNAKRFFMLVPQGNIVFGVISFKLLATPYIFLLFMLFAIVTLMLVNPKNIL